MKSSSEHNGEGVQGEDDFEDLLQDSEYPRMSKKCQIIPMDDDYLNAD